jgi:tetratricopeptide (TPR) repeat protein/transcriptional regulator with XRE-family HTH domain
MGTRLDNPEPDRFVRLTKHGVGDRLPNRQLRRCRLMRHWTLERTADALFALCTEQERRTRRGDINAKMISEWERGNHVPDAFWREKLCHLYEASAEDLGFVEPVPREQVSARKIATARSVLSGCDLPVIVTPGESLQTMQTMQVLPQVEPDPLELQAGAWLTLGIDHLAHLFDAGWSTDDILLSLQAVLQGVQAMSKLSRRHLLKLGAAAVVSSVTLPVASHVSIDEQISLCQAMGENIAAAWKLFHTASTEQVLAIGQAQLHLLQQSAHSLFPSVRPRFFSAVYRLIGATQQFQGQYMAALHAHEQAYLAALEGADSWQMAQSLSWQAYHWQARGCPAEAIQANDAALHLATAGRDLEALRLHARLLAESAALCAMLGRDQEMHRRLAASEALLEALPTPHEEFDRASWLQQAGCCALSLGKASEAVPYLERALESIPPQWTMRVLSAAIPLIQAYTRNQERDAAFALAQRTFPILQTLHAPALAQHYLTVMQRDFLTAFPQDKPGRALVSEAGRQMRLTTSD